MSLPFSVDVPCIADNGDIMPANFFHMDWRSEYKVRGCVHARKVGCVYEHARMLVRMCACACACVFVCEGEWLYVGAWVCVHARVLVCVRVCMHVRLS